jgi:hypothetical protein
MDKFILLGTDNNNFSLYPAAAFILEIENWVASDQVNGF